MVMSFAVYERPPTYNSSVPDNSRTVAIASLRQLYDCLRQGPGDLSGFVEQTEQIITAVEASHIEGVRFRLFGFRRQLGAHTGILPDEAVELLDQATAALQAAGFRT